MPGAVAPVPMLGALPGIPSPAQGVPTTPDLFTGLLQNAPSAIQGYQAGQQMRENRMKMAEQLLQEVAPLAATNPNNPQIIKSLQRAAKMMGLNPNTFVSENGGVNSSALIQYNPMYSAFVKALTSANPNPDIIKMLGNSLGIDVPDIGMSYKDVQSGPIKEFQSALKLYMEQGGSKDSLMAAATSAADALRRMGPSYGMEADGIMQQAIAAQPTQKATDTHQNVSSLITSRGIHDKQMQAYTNYIIDNTSAPGQKAALNASEIAKNYAQANAATENAKSNALKAQASLQEATAALARLSISTADGARAAVTSENTNLQALQKSLDSVNTQIRGYAQVTGRTSIKPQDLYMPQVDANGQPVLKNGVPQYVPSPLQGLLQQQKQLQTQIQQTKQAIQKTGFAGPDGYFDVNKVYSSALHGSGLPLTTKVNSVGPKVGDTIKGHKIIAVGTNKSNNKPIYKLDNGTVVYSDGSIAK